MREFQIPQCLSLIQRSFAALGTLSLITSFLPEKFSFFILRALAGLAGGGLVPASFRLITLVFDKHELNQAFTLFGASGSLANVSGILVAGVVQLIPGQGQMIAWRWFFRILSGESSALVLCNTTDCAQSSRYL